MANTPNPSIVTGKIHLTWVAAGGGATGYLIYRSAFLPRVLGALYALAGLAYLTNSIGHILVPAYANRLFPYTAVLSLLGEGSLCLWLLIVGLNATKWAVAQTAGEGSAQGA